MTKKQNKTFITYPRLLLGISTIGLGAAFIAAYERIQMLVEPGKELSCSLNPVLDCGGVLAAEQSSIFGPPNMFIAMVVFSIFIGFGLQLVSGGTLTSFARKVLLGLTYAMVLFSAWFFAVSLYDLGKICLFCLAIWPVTVILGVYNTKYYLEQEKNLSKNLKKVRDYLEGNHYFVVFLVFAIMITLFFVQFRDYYFG